MKVKVDRAVQFLVINLYLIIGPFFTQGHPIYTIVRSGSQVEQLVCYYILVIAGIALFFKTHLTEPGFVQDQVSEDSGFDKFHQIVDKQDPKVYCLKCDRIRPPRSRHCDECKNCIVKFDHHCPFFGVCIGGKNHRFFWWFLLVELVNSCWTIVMMFFGMRALSDLDEMNYYALAYEAIAFILLLWMLIAVFSLFCFHSFLALTNRTTYEVIKKRKIKQFIEEDMNIQDEPEKREEFFRNCILRLGIFHCAKLEPEWIYSPRGVANVSPNSP